VSIRDLAVRLTGENKHGHGFQDLGGHIWELIYMEPSAVKQG